MSRKRRKTEKRKGSSGNRSLTKRNDPFHYVNLGNTFLDQGRLDEAISSYQKALELKPDLVGAYYNLGNTFLDQGRLDEAISSYQKALELKPDLVGAYYNLGNTFLDQGRLDEAISSYQKALELKPDLAEPYNNMGIAFHDQGRLDEAIACYEKALKIKSDFPETYNNIGITLQDQGRLDEAIHYFHKALQLKPNLAEAYNCMGNALESQDKWDEAIACYKKALKIKPDLAEAYSGLIHQLQLTCAWQELKVLSAILDGLTKKALHNQRKTAESPFMSLTRHTDPSHNFAIAKSWSDNIARTRSNLGVHFSFDTGRSFKTKIAVGYLSSDFCNHAVAHLMLSLFGLHNRDQFEIHCYSYGMDDGSYYRARIQRDCDKFVDLCKLNDADSARHIYEDKIDILVDLKGYTRGNRLGICALRPAPIQVSYLGFPGTTGADFFDYIITDRIATPDSHTAYYSESFVYLPHCYQVNDRSQAISNKNWQKMDFGLPEASFVFCSFNRPYKIEPVVFDVWMKILRQVPEGVLWLPRGNEITEKNLRWEAEARGLKSERLIFAENLPEKDEHLARLKLADLALDTRIYNGHTTTSDALWAGVPVITLQGGHFASRVSSSILNAVGLPDLITYSLREYESLAVRLARNPDELREIRERLARNRLSEPLFDTPRFVRNIERAYKEMWQIFLAAEKPRQIEVVES